jgi:hypothetical protein
MGSVDTMTMANMVQIGDFMESLALEKCPELLHKAGVNQSYVDEREPLGNIAVEEWQRKLAKTF